MASLGDLMIRVGAEIEGFQSAMQSVVDQTQEACDAVAAKLESIGDVGQRLSILGASLTASITVPLEEIARQSIDVAGTFEQTSIAFTTLLGSAQASREMLANLYRFAASTPFEIPQVLQGARQLMAFGFSSKDVIPILRAVGDQAAALGLGGVGMERILLNLGKIEAQGKLTGHELRNLGEDGVAAVDMLAAALNKTPAEVSKMVSKGEVDPETAINAIMRGMQLRSGGLMAEEMGSFKAQFSNLSDQITLTKAAIGDTLLPLGNVLLSWAQEAVAKVKELAQWFGQLPAPIQAGAIALAGLAAAAGPAIGLIGALGYSLPYLAAGFQALSQVWAYIGTLGSTIMGFAGEIGTTTWMIGSLISEEGLLAAASYALSTGIGALGSVFLSVPALIVGVTVALAALATWVYTHWDGVKAAVATVWDGLGDMWNATLGPAISGVRSMFTELWSMVPSGFGSMWTSLKSGFSEFKAWLDEKNDAIYESTKKWIEQFPGVKKIESMTDAFHKGDQDAKDAKEVAALEHQLHVGKGEEPFTLTSKRDAWLAKHKQTVDEAVAALAKLEDAYHRGKVAQADFEQAQRNVELIKSDKMPDYLNGEASMGKTKVPKIDRNALDGLTGQHAHDEAAVAFRKAEIEHEYQMAQPGSSDVRESASNAAAEQIKAAEQRKQELDQIALEELQKTQQNIAEKLKLYKTDQAGHQALIEAKQKAEDKFLQAIQKNAFDLETVKKQANDRIAAEEQKAAEEREKRQQKEYEMELKTVDLKVQAQEKELQQQIKQHEFEATMADKQLQFELETGTLSKNQYLRLKQEQYDAAYQMEMDAIQKERAALEEEFAGLRARPGMDDVQKRQVEADYQKRIQPLNERQQTVQNRQTGRQQDTNLGIQRNQFQTIWAPVQNGFSTAISNMIKGTQTFKQAFQGMATSVLSSWIGSISQMAARWLTHLAMMGAQWIAHKILELVFHTSTEASKTAVSATGDATRLASATSTNVATGLSYAGVAAAAAFAANIWMGVVPAVAAAAEAYGIGAGFASLAAFEQGGLVPGTGVAMLHGGEMVLPASISQGLQGLIQNRGLALPNASSMASLAHGSGLSHSAAQMASAMAPMKSESSTHNYNGALHYHAAGGETLTVDTFGKIFKTYVRQNNLKMA